MDRDARVERIRRMARGTRMVVIVLWAISAFSLLVSLGTLDERVPRTGGFWIGGVWLRAEDFCGGPCAGLGDYGFDFLLRAAIHYGAYVCFWLWGTWSFERLLHCYQHGLVFGRVTARRIQSFGFALMGWAWVDVLALVLWTGAPHAGDPIRMTSFSTLLVGAVFVMIAWVMSEAAELAEEVELTV